MFSKLLKYDLKYIYKTVLIFILLLIVCAFLYNITAYQVEVISEADPITGQPIILEEIFPPTIILVLHTVFYNAIICFLIGLFINSAMRIWQRFKNNFYGDEAYLTHTLPIRRQTLWGEKFATIVIIGLSIVATIILTTLILQLTDGGPFTSLGIGHEGMPLSYNFAYFFIIMSEFVFIVMSGITGIIISNRVHLHAVLVSLGVYLVGTLTLLGAIFLWSLLSPDIMNGIFMSGGNDPHVIYDASFVTKVLVGIGCIYSAMIAALYIIDNKLLKQGINLK